MSMISILIYFLFNCRREREIEELMQLPPGQRRSRRNSYLSLLIGFSYVFCVAPFSICWFLPKSYPFTGFLLTLNHVVNPIVYFVKYFVDGRRRNRTIMEQKSCVPTATTTSTWCTLLTTILYEWAENFLRCGLLKLSDFPIPPIGFEIEKIPTVVFVLLSVDPFPNQFV